MLLVSAGISLLLGNQADAISIGMALGIVSAVAAIQEYRSEKGKLVNIIVLYSQISFLNNLKTRFILMSSFAFST
jgi:hypothetical protein